MSKGSERFAGPAVSRRVPVREGPAHYFAECALPDMINLPFRVLQTLPETRGDLARIPVMKNKAQEVEDRRAAVGTRIEYALSQSAGLLIHRVLSSAGQVYKLVGNAASMIRNCVDALKYPKKVLWGLVPESIYRESFSKVWSPIIEHPVLVGRRRFQV